MQLCEHLQVECLNPYEAIRKYRCADCSAVMMCACDEHRGRHFLPHQLSEGDDLDTHLKISVTHGFQPKVCRECRGLPPLPAPLAAIPGHTSKIKRFYWREIFFRELELLEAAGLLTDARLSVSPSPEVKQIGRQALEDIKRLHQESPKYSMVTESDADFLKRNDVPVTDAHELVLAGGVIVANENEHISPEQLAQRQLGELGYESILCESTPFHALFAVLLHPFIQNPTDPLLREAGFGERSSFEASGGLKSSSFIRTMLPEDFGSRGYGWRRKEDIDAFFNDELPHDRESLLLQFDSSVHGSEDLRQYLWAHRDCDVDQARKILATMKPDQVRRILRYLLDDYWGRYLGWPDIYAWNDAEALFVEVKLSRDKLSDDQRNWIEQNKVQLGFAFQILRIHRERQINR